MTEPEHIAQPAEHNEHENEDRRIEIELVRGDRGVVQREERARRARHGSGDDKGGHFVARHGDADALGGDAVIADGENGAPRAAVHKMEDHDEAEHHEDKAAGERGDLLHAANAHRSAENKLSALLQIFGRLQEADVVAAAVQADIKVRENALDDLAEGKRHDGEIVAAETQHRNADEKADDGSEDRADDHCDGETQRSARNNAPAATPPPSCP